MQLTFDFSDKVTLTDKDGDTIIVERYTDNVKAVRTFLSCTKSDVTHKDYERFYLL